MADEALQEYRAEKAEPLTNLNFALVIGDEDLPVSGRDWARRRTMGEPIPEEPSGDVKVFPEVHTAVAGLG